MPHCAKQETGATFPNKSIESHSSGGEQVSFDQRNRVKVRILNQEYILISPAAPDHLERLAKLVEQRMRDMIAKDARVSITRAAVLTAMQFADQALTSNSEQTRLANELAACRSENEVLKQELQQLRNAAQHRSNPRSKGRR